MGSDEPLSAPEHVYHSLSSEVIWTLPSILWPTSTPHKALISHQDDRDTSQDSRLCAGEEVSPLSTLCLDPYLGTRVCFEPQELRVPGLPVAASSPPF